MCSAQPTEPTTVRSVVCDRGCMAESVQYDWIWLSTGAIEDFKQWRIGTGATAASAASYASGARRFVAYCRSIEENPTDAVETFHSHLGQVGDLSVRARADYRSHARSFVEFLTSTPRRTASAPLRTTTRRVPGPAGDERSRPVPPDVPQSPWLACFEDLSTSDLLAGYARTLAILRARGVLRTANAPAGDYAEWLVWRAFGGTIEPNSTKSHDVTDAVGRRLQVKARLVSPKPTPGQLQTSVFRSWSFDFAVLVQLAERDYTVVRAAMLPASVFDGGNANASWSGHVKGWAVFMTPALMSHPDATDVTEALSVASREH